MRKFINNIQTIFPYFYSMIYTLGESLMDIIFDENSNISAKAGGAMLNLAVSLGRCGLEVCLVSELGDDKVAEDIVLFLNKNRVETKNIRNYNKQSTSIALAFLDQNKKPTYSFHKAYPENRNLKLPSAISKNDVLIFGSFYSLDKKIRTQIKQFVSLAKSKEALIIYDPNIRQAHHLKDKETMEAVMENIALADIVKGSDEDFENIFGKFEEGLVLSKIRKINEDAIVIFTKGEKGATIVSGNKIFTERAKKINIVSTIGAGDNFTAGLTYFISQLPLEKRNPKHFSETELQNMLRTATKFSANVCQSLDNYVSHEFANSL